MNRRMSAPAPGYVIDDLNTTHHWPTGCCEGLSRERESVSVNKSGKSHAPAEGLTVRDPLLLARSGKSLQSHKVISSQHPACSQLGTPRLTILIELEWLCGVVGRRGSGNANRRARATAQTAAVRASGPRARPLEPTVTDQTITLRATTQPVHPAYKQPHRSAYRSLGYDSPHVLATPAHRTAKQPGRCLSGRRTARGSQPGRPHPQPQTEVSAEFHPTTNHPSQSMTSVRSTLQPPRTHLLAARVGVDSLRGRRGRIVKTPGTAPLTAHQLNLPRSAWKKAGQSRGLTLTRSRIG